MFTKCTDFVTDPATSEALYSGASSADKSRIIYDGYASMSLATIMIVMIMIMTITIIIILLLRSITWIFLVISQ